MHQRSLDQSKSLFGGSCTSLLNYHIQQVANGEIEDWTIEAIKANMCRNYDLRLESNEGKADLLMSAFINEEDMQEALNYKEAIMAITLDDAKRVAK